MKKKIIKREIRPLDFVLTPEGNIALVDETNENNGLIEVSITFINPEHGKERNAWWKEEDLKVINSLPYILADGMRHPFGKGLITVKKHFGI